MRRLIIALVLLLAVYLALSRLTEVQQVAETLRHGNVWWLGLAVLAQLAWLANLALTYKSVYRLLGLESSVAQLLPLAITSNFVNVVAPSVGVGGMAIFITDARRRGQSAARVTIAGVLFLLFDYFAFLIVLALGLTVLFRRNNLTGIELTASGGLLAVALALAGLLVLGVSAPPAFERVLIALVRGVNRGVRPVLRRDYLSEARAHEFAVEAAEGLGALRTHPREYLLPALLSLLSKALLIAILWVCFMAFGTPFTGGTLVAGYSIANLFTIVSPTPAGIGVVEGAMTLGLRSLRVSIGAATIITLAYRGLTFWLPFAYGFAALRFLEWQWGRKAAEKVAP